MEQPRSSEIHRLLGFSCVKVEAASTAPVPEGLHKLPVFLLLSTPDTCHNSCIISIFYMWLDFELYLKSTV